MTGKDAMGDAAAAEAARIYGAISADHVLPDVLVEKVKHHKNLGWSVPQIADFLGITSARVVEILAGRVE